MGQAAPGTYRLYTNSVNLLGLVLVVLVTGEEMVCKLLIRSCYSIRVDADFYSLNTTFMQYFCGLHDMVETTTGIRLFPTAHAASGVCDLRSWPIPPQASMATIAMDVNLAFSYV